MTERALVDLAAAVVLLAGLALVSLPSDAAAIAGGVLALAAVVLYASGGPVYEEDPGVDPDRSVGAADGECRAVPVGLAHEGVQG